VSTFYLLVLNETTMAHNVCTKQRFFRGSLDEPCVIKRLPLHFLFPPQSTRTAHTQAHGGNADLNGVFMHDILVRLGKPLLVFDVPAKGREKGVLEFTTQLCFVVIAGFVGFFVAVEAVNQVEDSFGGGHLAGKCIEKTLKNLLWPRADGHVCSIGTFNEGSNNLLNRPINPPSPAVELVSPIVSRLPRLMKRLPSCIESPSASIKRASPSVEAMSAAVKSVSAFLKPMSGSF